VRSRKKRKTSKKVGGAVGEDRMPILTVTSSHRVAVLVENNAAKSSSNDNSTSNKVEDPIQNGFEESSFLQFASRPGKATAFLPSEDGDVKSMGLRIVPAAFDAERNRIYALQRNNTRLVCYAASSASGRENEASSSNAVDLEHAALSLSLLNLPRTFSKNPPRCLAYGTCQDGRIYVAALTGEKEPSIVVEYFDTETQSSAKDYVGTLAHLVAVSTDDKTGSKIKRKPETSSSSGECELIIHQAFQQSNGVLLLRQRIHVAALILKGSNWVSSIASGFREGPHQFAVDLSKRASVSNVSIFGMVEENDAIAMYFSNSEGQSFCTSVSLRTGGTIGAPFLLPQDTQQAGLVGPALIAVLTKACGMFPMTPTLVDDNYSLLTCASLHLRSSSTCI